MSERIHALAQRLFGKATIEECSAEEVKSLAQRFPYFAPAQFLLLEKLKQEGSEDYSSQLQKSILYYPDPLAFQIFIASEKFYTDVSFEGEKQISDEKNEQETINTFPETGDWSEVVKDENDFTTPQQQVGVEESEPVNDHAVVMPEDVPVVVAEQDVPAPESTIKISMPDLQVSQPATGLTFEPFHTVDYFASQGIKLSQEEMPKDKFGKQLKSFTEWLKTMKRLPAKQIPAAADSGSETKVQNLAEDSVHDSNVWTEAMAEVWIKQGNTQKAIETYNKLSLLNPSKRAYFATKIENLKRS